MIEQVCASEQSDDDGGPIRGMSGAPLGRGFDRAGGCGQRPVIASRYCRMPAAMIIAIGGDVKNCLPADESAQPHRCEAAEECSKILRHKRAYFSIPQLLNRSVDAKPNCSGVLCCAAAFGKRANNCVEKSRRRRIKREERA